MGVLHEVQKSHPRDWENPGRVRVQWKKDGKFVNPLVKTSAYASERCTTLIFSLFALSEKQLLEIISSQIQYSKPDNIPKRPYAFSPVSQTSEPPPPSKAAKGKGKGKQITAPVKVSRRRLPVPPDPLPQLTSRLSAYSPAVPSGVLIETVKAGMNAPDGGHAPSIPGVGGSGAGKGKRKIVRVR